MLRRLLNLFRKRALDAELDEEIRFHLEALEAEHRSRGLSAEEARRTAIRDMGGIDQAKEAYRDQRGLPPLEDLWRDARFGLRSLRRTPGLTAALVATLAIAIGANAAIFAVIDAVLLRPLPYPDAGALLSVGHVTPRNGEELPSAPYLYFTYREQNRTLAGVGLWRTTTANVTGRGAPEQVPALAVTSEVLRVLGVEALLGRTFSDLDDAPGSRATVVLGYGLWQRRFGGDRAVVGGTLVVDGQPMQVIGVMPPRFRFLDRTVDVFFPFQFDRRQVTLGRYVFHSLARLRAGATLAEAQADLTRLVPTAVDSFPPPPGYTRERFHAFPIRPRLRPLRDEVIGEIGRTLWVLMGALGLVLLIAAANVANLLLVRTDGRQQELAVRAALGAGRGRIARQLLIESVLLAVLGGGAGLVVAQGSLRVLMALRPAGLPRLDEIAIDPRVLLFTAAVSLLTGVLLGLLPVVRYAGPRLATALRSGGRSMTASRERHRVQGALVVAQVAVALVLLVCSGLMIRTVRALGRVDPGFAHPEHVQLMRLAIASTEVPDLERVTRLQHEVVERIAAIPGVESVAFADIAPLAGGSDSDTVLFAEGRVLPPGQSRALRRFEFISPGLFRTLGTPVVAGRDLSWEDLYGRRMVALVSEGLARAEWGSAEDALRRRVRASPDDPWREIVGVVGNIRDDGLSRRPPPIVYFPALTDRFWSRPTLAVRSVTFLIRSPHAGQESFLGAVRRAVGEADANLPLAEVLTLAEVQRHSLARTSFTLILLGTGGAMGLLLGLVGLYGVIAYAVSQRTLEIGIRMALGAPAAEVKRMFLRRGVLLAGMGVAAGLTVAAPLSRVMSSLLFGVSPIDPLTYAAVAVVLMAMAAVAAYVPARRSTRVDPIEALRCG